MVRLWFTVETIVNDALRSWAILRPGERQEIAEGVADEVELRAQKLAWLELLDGTTFDRVGESPEHLGQSVYSAVESFLSLSPRAQKLNLPYKARVEIAERVNTKIADADVIVLNNGVRFKRGFSPRQVGNYKALALYHVFHIFIPYETKKLGGDAIIYSHSQGDWNELKGKKGWLWTLPTSLFTEVPCENWTPQDWYKYAIGKGFKGHAL